MTRWRVACHWPLASYARAAEIGPPDSWFIECYYTVGVYTGELSKLH